MLHTLVYDSDCGPCRRFKDAVAFLDGRRRMEYVGLHAAERRGLLERVGPPLRRRSFHLIGPDGKALSGAEALPKLIALLPGGRPVALALKRCPPASRSATLAYSVFSRLHDSGACSYESNP